MGKIKFWLNNARPVALPQSVMPAITAFFLAMGQEGFSWWIGVLAIVGGCLAHLGMNLADDYYDYKKKETGFRESLAREGIRARTTKCPYIVSGEATLQQTFRVVILYGILALIPGVIVFAMRGWPILLIVVIAVILGESYSGDPLRLSYRGFGELDIGAMFGPLLMMGVYYAACGHFSWELLAPAISMGLLVTNVLYVHSVLDIEADQKAQKNTLAAVLKTDKNRMAALWLIIFVPYIITAVMAVVTVILPWVENTVDYAGENMVLSMVSAWNLLYLLVFATLPWAIKLFSSMREFVKNPAGEVTFKGWYGPMKNWEHIVAGKLDWFMFRWYLARNLMTAFALIYVVVSVVLFVIDKIQGTMMYGVSFVF
ncbi:MAG: prenyltransferase [Eubacterium sp.]|nr:prenyltransferase [Eubacterium sp.]